MFVAFFCLRRVRIVCLPVTIRTEVNALLDFRDHRSLGRAVRDQLLNASDLLPFVYMVEEETTRVRLDTTATPRVCLYS